MCSFFYIVYLKLAQTFLLTSVKKFFFEAQISVFGKQQVIWWTFKKKSPQLAMDPKTNILDQGYPTHGPPGAAIT